MVLNLAVSVNMIPGPKAESQGAVAEFLALSTVKCSVLVVRIEPCPSVS